MDYINATYRTKYRIDSRVIYTGDGYAKIGTVVGARSAYLRVQMDGEKSIGLYHPTWEMKAVE
jgi:hypothetical protein